MKYNCVIIGAGSIGALKPTIYDSPRSEHKLTHAHAITARKDMSLVGIVDIDYLKAVKAGKKWTCRSYQYLDEIPNGIDIAVVACPTEHHASVMKQLITREPKLVIVEKPFTLNYKECKYISELYQKAGIPIVVNYNRRFLFEMRTLVDELKLKKIQAVNVHYCRGLKRDGSHAIDMLNWIFGKPEYMKIMENETPRELTGDPTYSVFFRYKKCDNVVMQGLSGKPYKIFDMSVYTKDGVIMCLDFFKKIYRVKTYKSEWGTFDALDVPKDVDTDVVVLHNHLWYMYQNVVAYLKGKGTLLCTAKDGLAVHEIYSGLGI